MLNNYRAVIYGHYTLSTRVVNARDINKNIQINYLTTNLKDLDFILNYS